MRKTVKVSIALVLIGAVGIGGFTAYKKLSHKPAMSRDMMNNGLTEKVSRNTMEEIITASGSVLLEDEIEVYAEGEVNKIKTILVEEGDYVQAGQILVEYDVDDTKEELENKIRDTKLEIENTQLSLKSIALPKTDSEMTKLENQVTSAEKSLYDAKNTYSNYETKLSQQQATIDELKTELETAQKDMNDNAKLLEVGGVTQTEFDDSKANYTKKVNSYNNAVSELEQLKTDKTSAQLNVKNAENSLKEAKSSLAEAQNVFSSEATRIKYEQQKLTLQQQQTNLADYEKDLSELVYTTTSKVSGIVTEVCVDEGTYTEENTVMLKVADFDKLIVSANIEEYDAPSLAVGQRVNMTTDGIPDTVYTGTITKINPSASSATSMMGTETVVPIEISVDNPDGVLKPNFSLDLEIAVIDRPDVLTVPTSSLDYDAEAEIYYVYKVNDKTIEKTMVEVGEYGDTQVEILSGVNENDEVIASYNDKIVDGMSMDELMEMQREQNQAQNMNEGGNKNDSNQGFNQMLPSGGPGGNGFGGGMPQGGPR